MARSRLSSDRDRRSLQRPDVRALMYQGLGNAFSPLSLGPTIWLDGGKGISLNGGAVSAWADQSGNGNNFTQANPLLQPLYIPSESRMNGKPGVGFSVSENALSTLNSITIKTFFAVAVYPSGPNFSDYSTIIGDGPLSFIFRGEISTANWRPGDAPGNRWRDGTLTDNAGLPGPHVYEAEITAAITAITWVIGDDPFSAGRIWSDTICEIIAYAGALTTSQRQQVRQYLGTKYRITVT